jgi:putative ATP-binding cassette transporter
MQLLRFLITRSRRNLALAILFGFLSGAFNSGLLALANMAITGSQRKSLLLIGAFVALCVLAPLTRMVSEMLLVSLGQNAVFSLRIELAQQVLSVPMRQLEQVGPHRILSVLTDDVPNVANAVTAIPLLSINAGVVIGSLGYMGWLEWKLLAVVLGFMALGIFSYYAGVAKAMSHLRRARRHDNDLQRHFRGLIEGIKELKLHQLRRNAFLSDALEHTADESRSANVSGLSIYSVASSWGQLLVFVMLGLLVFVLHPVMGFAPIVLIGFSLALLYMMTPLQVIMNSIPALARANVAIGNAQSLGFTLVRSAAPSEYPSITQFQPASATLDLTGITYSYGEEDSADQFVLGPIDLTINPGELLFIAGGNGSGKTTLAKLIVGLYVPDTGAIRYGHTLVSDSNRDNYRQLFSVVFSDPFLFESLHGLEKAQLDQRAQEYLRRLQLSEKVTVKEGVLSTTDLSHGQRKRLALLTCYLEDRPIYFFDEWAADQDPKFKELFYYSLLPELKARGKTVVVISHDDRYYGVADRVMTLESGCLSGVRNHTAITA